MKRDDEPHIETIIECSKDQMEHFVGNLTSTRPGGKKNPLESLHRFGL
jgi:hypothetical protein